MTFSVIWLRVAQDPQTIGRYRVLRTLGAGGMGVVYLAEDPALKRRVAVKLVRGGGLEQDQALVRFQREAEVSARLNHPNVITIYDVGEEPGIGPFITMEYVEGSNLAEHARDNALDGEARLKLLIQAMRALEAAHAAGIIHRDIKPANLMVSRDGRVKLMDFGIARAGEATLTMTGAVLGTPSYIAPEQLAGSEPSAATDRYAFSVMAFELFAGCQPYAGTAASVILYKVAHEPPSMPESMDARLRQVFLRALAKNPAERHPDLPAFLRALIDASALESSARVRLLATLDEERGLAGQAPQPAAGTQIVQPPAVSPTPGSAWKVAWLLVPVAVTGVVIVVWLRTFSRPSPAVSPSAAVASAPAATPVAPTLPPAAESRTPSSEEIALHIHERLRREGLSQVAVSVDSQGRLVLANLADAREEAQARKVAEEVGGANLTITTSIRKAAVVEKRRARVAVETAVREPAAPAKRREPSAPSWGEIQREGADKTE